MNPEASLLKSLFTALFILVVAFLSSCQSYKDSICRKCPLKIKDSISYVTTVTPFDTTLFLSGYKSEMSFTNCDSLLNELSRSHDTIYIKENGIKETITRSKKGIIFKCEADSLKAVITLLKTKIESNHDRVVEVSARCQLEHLTWWDRFWIKVGKYESLLIGISILGFIAKLYFKL